MNRSAALSDAMLQIADRLGYTVGEVYQIYVEAQTAKALTGSLTLVLAGLSATTAAYVTFSRVRDSENLNDPEDAYLAAIMVGMIGLVLGVGAADLLGEILMRLLVPEYMAVQDLLGEVSSLG